MSNPDCLLLGEETASSSTRTAWVLASLLGSNAKPAMDEQRGRLCTVLPTPA